MIKHIVMWIIKDEALGKTKHENITELKKRLEGLVDIIEEINELEVGININKSDAAYDVALYSSFLTEEDLNTYINHPDHCALADFVNAIRESRVVVDYVV